MRIARLRRRRQGNDSIGLGAKAEVLTIDLGAGNDKLTHGSATSGTIITLGEGSDVVIFNATAQYEDELTEDNYLRNITDASKANFAAQIITITDFNGAQDVLRFEGKLRPTLQDEITVLSNDQAAAVDELDDLFSAVSFVATQIGADTWTTFQYGGNTYIFQNNNGEGFDAKDGLIELVGFTGSLDDANFVLGVSPPER